MSCLPAPLVTAGDPNPRSEVAAAPSGHSDGHLLCSAGPHTPTWQTLPRRHTCATGG